MNTRNKIKRLTLLSLFIAIGIVVSILPPMFLLDGSLRITFTFLVSMTVACLFNWKECMIYGIAVDIISFCISSLGDVFFPGYTLSAVLGVLIYRWFLCTDVTLKDIIAAKLSVNILVNVLLGSLWRTILYSNGFWFYVSASLVKNIVLVPFEVLAFYLLYSKVIVKLKEKMYE